MGRVGAKCHSEGEMKRTALPNLALDPELAAHHLDQPFRDRQAEAGASILRVVEPSACVNASKIFSNFSPGTRRCRYR